MTDAEFKVLQARKKKEYEKILLPEGAEKILALEAEERELENKLMSDVPYYPFNHEKSRERCELHKKYANLTWKVYCQYKKKQE